MTSFDTVLAGGTLADSSLDEGWELRGWPRLTNLRGALVHRDGAPTADGPSGVSLGRQ